MIAKSDNRWLPKYQDSEEKLEKKRMAVGIGVRDKGWQVKIWCLQT